MLKEIESQISQIREQLLREAVTGHPLLNARWLEIESDLILARLVLLSAKLNKYRFSRLKPVAVALELLDLAVKRHYKSDGRWQMADGRWQMADGRWQRSNLQPPTSNPNLSLIAGDYFYAKALAIVAALKDSLVVEILSQAIANIAEGMSSGAEDEQLKKRASLYVVACQLGAYLSGNSSSITKALMDYGQNFGIVCKIKAKNNNLQGAEKFFNLAQEALFSIPESPHRQELAGLLNLLISSWKSNSTAGQMTKTE